MILALILGALLGAFAVVFAIDNSALITVHLLSWDFTAPIAFVLIVAMLIGIIFTLVAMIPQAIRASMEAYAARREKRIAEVEEVTVIAQ